MEPTERPTTIHISEEDLAPRGPWSFLRSSLPGGFTRWGWGLMGGWMLALLGSTLGWAGHLRRAAGWSALPSHWGESLSARDIWELVENGGLKHSFTNSPTVHLFALGIIIVLWCGWRLQAEEAALKARLSSWLLGALDTLLIGFLPLGLVAWLVDLFLAKLGASGIEALGWTAFFGRPLVWMGLVAALNLQWWFCRLGRLAGPPRGYRAHLADSFLRLWSHPIQWGLISVGGAALRALLPFLVLLLAWRMGGGTTFRVWLFLLLQLLVTAINGWLMGWLLRLAAQFWSHDVIVRDVRAALKESVREASAL
ncbi:hypothetical protein [Geothrix sp. PMB-07]|uniref:hypothetical protein n=1 Tax=Geothrix sp. PMB-07 TaxID=3068640 RepID=UPI002741B883|nr:hypothetical protein [Geothrix sp. PMB-07]WLT30154.1 hypothetical protein Q9293_10535 [Geothrix sp. PMB-07]